MKHLILILTILTMGFSSQAKVEALFHPYDNTMEKIAEIFMKADKTIDMALYNIDSKKRNPVIAALLSDKLQAKIKSGELVVRIIFEGYMTKEDNFKKMKILEELGVNAKYLGASQKMHHKFATIDSGSDNPILITGSANWSMMSQRNYNENILFIENKPGITNNFQREFELLWSQAKEYGNVHEEYYGLANLIQIDFILEPGLDVSFNTDNFYIKGDKFRKSKDTTYVLTRKLVKAIDSAESKIEIATTRLKLRPVYDAILRAAARGVQIQIVVSMGEFEPKFLREKSQIRQFVKKGKKYVQCAGSFERKCSTSQNFAAYLSDLEYIGKKNVSVRVKHFDLRHEAYLLKQMHSKYMIVDDKDVLTGSFNWSYSAEYNHFENLIALDGDNYPQAVSSFNQDFYKLWSLERGNLYGMMSALDRKENFTCSYEPMSLSFQEADALLDAARNVSGSIRKFCKSKVTVDLSE